MGRKSREKRQRRLTGPAETAAPTSPQPSKRAALEEGPPPMPGMTWVRLECPKCHGPWWQGIDDNDPASTRAGVELMAKMLGACSDCRNAA